ncbi:MAG: 3-phosphoshikimate 1-carboxyvinyltransferase [Oscillospiraceae bacterium]|nr:3-phosphoshikimate 1-carboxyvinyltransferase [Oscillospiraceae bacterium]
MRVTIAPRQLGGSIKAIASKSEAHRLLICAALARGETEIACGQLSADINATADCLRALGADIDYSGGVFRVKPLDGSTRGAVLDVGESGSTLRFLLPVACALGAECKIKMHGRLPARPLSPLWEELEAHGAVLTRPEPDVISVSGTLAAGDYTLAANVSSQFISGLLFALPLLERDSRIVLTGDIESAGYIDMTVRALRRFGSDCELCGRTFAVKGGRPLRSPKTAEVEGDWSNAAFWLTAGAISQNNIVVEGLAADSPQGDRAAAAALAEIRRGGAVIDARDIPDLVPVLSVAAAVSPGTTEFTGAARLRIKESDRLAATAAMLTALGGDAEERPDGLIVRGKPALAGGTVSSCNDHRIAMSAAVASVACTGSVTVDGAEAVGKSYPAFWDDFESLGGCITREE